MRIFAPVVPEHRKHNALPKQPVRGTKKSAGYDFFLPEDLYLNPNERKLVWTDIKAYMSDDERLEMHIRSSIANKHFVLLNNGTGIVDADYADNPKNDGNIGLMFWNTSDKVFSLGAGEHIAQGIFSPYLITDDDEAEGERTGGFGSTTDKGGETE